MAHKTLVNGVAYDVIGGETLVNGTSYSITGGKTLVNGTAYDISFSTTPTFDWDTATWADVYNLCKAAQQNQVNLRDYITVGATKEVSSTSSFEYSGTTPIATVLDIDKEAPGTITISIGAKFITPNNFDGANLDSQIVTELDSYIYPVKKYVVHSTQRYDSQYSRYYKQTQTVDLSPTAISYWAFSGNELGLKDGYTVEFNSTSIGSCTTAFSENVTTAYEYFINGNTRGKLADIINYKDAYTNRVLTIRGETHYNSTYWHPFITAALYNSTIPISSADVSKGYANTYSSYPVIVGCVIG